MVAVAALALLSNPSPVLHALERRFEILVRQGDAPTSAFAAVKFDNLSTDDAALASGYAFVLAREVSKYPTALVKRSGLKQIALVKNLTLDNVPVGAVGDYKQEILYCDPFVGKGNDTYRRHILHHDFFHMLDEQVNGSAYYKDPAWMGLNPGGFEYGKGGIHDRSPDATLLSHPAVGFITRYAMSGIEEDRAEVFACLFVPIHRRSIEQFAAEDKVLASKMELLKQQVRTWCPEAKL